MFLTDQELIALTGKERPRAQQKALNQMGIPYRVRADGHTLVLDEAVQRHFSIAEPKPKAKVFRLNTSNA
ncbi:DUF4224 domain-containing protein [Herbaspirillum robiniae]|uniref:DUF4224 domain-containing protein n=1 Tax=Herbaspirillum robiniae TaxID=2014887 RepID=UPI0009A19B96|nr:DUF4224 domain-containing protein [Herbaspirillum robiniae]